MGRLSKYLMITKVIEQAGEIVGYIFIAKKDNVPVVRTNREGVLERINLSERRDIVLGLRDAYTTLCQGEYLGECSDLFGRRVSMYKRKDSVGQPAYYLNNNPEGSSLFDGILRRDINEYSLSLDKEYLLDCKKVDCFE